jgi:hypothetical protein
LKDSKLDATSSVIIGLIVLVLLLSGVLLPSITVLASGGVLSQHLANDRIFDEIKYKFEAADVCKDNNLSGGFNQNIGVANHPLDIIIHHMQRGEQINSKSKLNEDCFFHQRINYASYNNTASFNNIKGLGDNKGSFNNNTASFNNIKGLGDNKGSFNNNIK